MTDDRAYGAIAAWNRIDARRRTSFAVGWIGMRSLTSVGGREDATYITSASAPVFGHYDSPTSDPYFVYLGEDPLFRRRESDALYLRGDASWSARTGSRVQAGAGVSYHAVSLYELDGTLLGRRPGMDSLRSYRAYAPGAYAYGQGRWIFEGLVLNAGLRTEWFTAGPQADDQSYGSPASGLWTLSPRVGFAFPMSDRDVLSFAYSRIRQAPARDYLYDNRRVISNRQPLGNPGLVPATAISYEGSAKHLFHAALSAQVSVFYRDLHGLVGARRFAPPGEPAALRYESADQSHGRGLEASVYGSWDGGWIEGSYTYLEARGTESLEEGEPFGLERGPRPQPIQTVPLDWDQSHVLRVSAFWQPGST